MAELMSRLPRGRRAAQRPGGATAGACQRRARGMAPRLVALLGLSAWARWPTASSSTAPTPGAAGTWRASGARQAPPRSRAAVRRAKYTEGVAEGVAHRAAHAMPGVGKRKEPLDDVSLAQKVEGEAFRQASVSKAHVSVNAEGGVVYLRGRLDSEREIEALVRAAGAVEGVNRVENKLHTAQTATSEQGADARWPVRGPRH